jgi:hypothetical protein
MATNLDKFKEELKKLIAKGNILHYNMAYDLNLLRPDQIKEIDKSGTRIVDFKKEYVVDTTKMVRNLQDNDTIWWRVRAHNAAGWGSWSAKRWCTVKFLTTSITTTEQPRSYGFNLSGRNGLIRYALPEAGHVSLRLYSINGALKTEVVNKNQAAGYYGLSIQNGKIAAGSYLAVFKAGRYRKEKMVFLMK